MQFNWLPYADYENIQDYIDDADEPLFQSNTALISFWIVKRHNPERVMKQFCLQQVVPPHFQRPFPPNEMVSIGDNKREKIRSIYSGLWNTRMDAITLERWAMLACTWMRTSSGKHHSASHRSSNLRFGPQPELHSISSKFLHLTLLTPQTSIDLHFI